MIVGLPRLFEAFTTASTPDVLAVLNSRPESVNVGKLMQRVLAQFADACVVIWFHAQKRLYASSDGVTAQDMETAFMSDTGPTLRLQPRAGQYGVNMLYEATEDSLFDVGLTDLLGNSYQKRSFWGLVNSGLAFRQEEQAPMTNVMVSQRSVSIVFQQPVGQGYTAVNALTPAGNSLAVELVQPATRLIWE